MYCKYRALKQFMHLWTIDHDVFKRVKPHEANLPVIFRQLILKFEATTIRPSGSEAPLSCNVISSLALGDARCQRVLPVVADGQTSHIPHP